MVATVILECGHEPSPHTSLTMGYGQDDEGNRYCYPCCGERDRERMVRDGKATLYWTGCSYQRTAKPGRWELPRFNFGERDCGEVANWCESLRFIVVELRHSFHNLAGKRYDVWFIGPDGKRWHGVQYGENTQLVHCKRVKGK